MSRDVTWEINLRTKFELDTNYQSRVTTTKFPLTPSLKSQCFYVLG